MYPLHRPRLLSCATVALLLVLSGCTLDFDQFDVPDADPGTNQDIPDTDTPDTDTPDTDTDPPDADVNDITVDPGEFGATCDEDEDCDGEGLCRAGICLQACQSDSDCPSHGICLRFGHEDLCAPRCDDQESCSMYTHRDDLECAYVLDTLSLGASPHTLRRACLPDEDGDGVFDLVDNCPGTIHPTQRDSTGDGIGDACADHPYCHADATDGVLDYQTTSFRAGAFAIPSFIDDRYLAVLGTVDDEGSPESTLLILDRSTGEWHDHGAVRYAGTDRHILADNRGGFAITPGVRDASGSPVGAWAFFDPNGALSYGPTYTSSGSRPTLGMTRFSNGEIREFYVDSSPSGEAVFNVLFAFRRNTPTMSITGITSSTQLSESDLSAVGRFQALARPDGTTSFLAFDPSDRNLYFFDFPTPSNQAFTIRSIPEEWEDPDPADLENPDVEDLSDFDPFFVPAPGGQIYAFDRNTGRAGRFLSTWSAGSITSRSYSSFERIPEYDLEELEGFDSFEVYLLPQARGFGLVGRPTGETDSLLVREIYFACHPRTDALDTSGDGVGDLIDNCPTEENSDQADLDYDSYGDACDPDIDGDRIHNDSDFIEVDTGEEDSEGQPIFETVDLSRDSTNDGTDNVDADDTDGDGISVDQDPLPLDTSNNGTPNRWSTDASGNGFSDNVLRNLDLDPYNYFSLLSGRTFAFLTESSSGQRTLYYGRVDDPRNTQSASLPQGVNPHGLTYGTDDNLLVFMAGPPEETENFLVYDIDAGEVVTNQPVYAAIRSVTMINSTTFLVVHEVDGTDRWQVSRVTIDPNFSRSEVFSELPYVWYADVHEDNLFLLASETDCRECASAFRFDTEEETFSLLPGGSHEILDIYSHQGMVSFLALEEGADAPRVWHIHPSGTGTLGTIEYPEEFSTPLAISFSRRQNNSGTPQDTTRPFAMTAMSRWGQPTDIWIANPINNQWRLLLAGPAQVVEVAWSP